MGVLEITQSTLRFQHQLMQEYFAALELDNFIVDENLHIKYWGKTGWEEVTIMLAGVKDDASELVNAIAKLNPVLAARCISEGMASVESETRQNITEKLVRTIENLADNIKERISAGIVIGEFEDPRFKRLPSPKNFVIVPPTIKITEGAYLIGRDKIVSSSYSDETPQHPVRLNKYEIGKYSITNAEFEGFIKDNGYDKEEYWSHEGWAWRQGKIDNELKTWLIDGYRKVRRQVLEEVERLEPSRPEDSEEMDVWWNILMEWSDDRSEIELEKIFFEQNCRPHNEPHYWSDPFFNGKKQPVIVTWFEAQAYCHWLSTILNKKYRLPTEAEWEASAGSSTLQYIWGNEADSTKFNILPTGIMRTTPVGIFSSGASKYGVNDLLGNVWEWTSSAKFPYPYNNDDGREKSFLPDCRRIVRGGSWAVSPSSARIPCRGNFPPDNMVRNYIGFRVVCES
jgi:formylglycine-generating enzyme required for sulfatase activity